MDKKGKIIFVLSLCVIALLVAFSIIVSREVATLKHEINKIAHAQPQTVDTEEIARKVSGLIEVPVPKNGIDGKDGVSIAGENGKDSVSTHTQTIIEKETVIKEQVPLAPLPAKDGAKGADAPRLLIQLNPLTNNLETRYENTPFWEVLVPCEKLIISCIKVGL